MNKKLYVGNLLYEVTDEELRDLFSQVGNVVTSQVIRYSDSGRSKGFGFVEMESEEEAQKAIESFHGQDYKGRKLVVSEARPPSEGPRRSFRGGNRGGNRHGGGFGGGNRDRGGYRNDDMGGGDQGGDYGDNQ